MTVLTEPFSVPYYFGPEKRSERFAESEPEASYAAVEAQIASSSGPLFVSDRIFCRKVRPASIAALPVT